MTVMELHWFLHSSLALSMTCSKLSMCSPQGCRDHTMLVMCCPPHNWVWKESKFIDESDVCVHEYVIMISLGLKPKFRSGDKPSVRYHFILTRTLQQDGAYMCKYPGTCMDYCFDYWKTKNPTYRSLSLKNLFEAMFSAQKNKQQRRKLSANFTKLQNL